MLSIRRIDSRRDDIRVAMNALRQRLSPDGNIVSEAGRQRTLEVFGEPLSPVEWSNAFATSENPRPAGGA